MSNNPKDFEDLVGLQVTWNKPLKDRKQSWNREAFGDVGEIRRVFRQEALPEYNQPSLILFNVAFAGNGGNYTRILELDDMDFIE